MTEETAIVLAYTKIQDNRIVLHTLSSSYGRKSFLIRIGPKTRMSLFLPLNVVVLSVKENPKSSLWFATPLGVKYPLIGIRDNFFKNTISMFMSEVLYRTISEGAYGDGIVEWCEKQILTLDGLENDFSNYHIHFLMELCTILGFRPSAEDMLRFSGGNQAVIERLIDADLTETLMVPLNGKLRNEIAVSILKYLEFHTEASINIRSLQVLREIYG